jgi:hypothetical protein
VKASSSTNSALFHLHASVGSRDKNVSAGGRHAYLMREGISVKQSPLIAAYSGNMPQWAEADPGLYWRMADLFERERAVLYREIEVALPRGIPAKRRLPTVKSMAEKIAVSADGRHPYTLAMHSGKDAENWSCHILVSERVNDGIARDPATWFSRVATILRKKDETESSFQGRLKVLDPGKGGAKKTRAMQSTEWLLSQRKNWEVICNQALEAAGRSERVDCRSYKDRGIERIPQIHLGRKAHRMMEKGVTNERVAKWQEIEAANAKLHEDQERAKSAQAALKSVIARTEAAAARRGASGRQAAIEFMRAKYPEVFTKTIEAATEWFRERRSESTPTPEDEAKLTARQIFEADLNSSQSEALRAAKERKQSAENLLRSGQEQLDSGYRKLGFLGKVGYTMGLAPGSVKPWAGAVAEGMKNIKSAEAEIAKVDLWFETVGHGVYAEVAKRQHAAIDQKLATMKSNRDGWTQIEKATLAVIADEHRKRAEAAKDRKRQDSGREPRL